MVYWLAVDSDGLLVAYLAAYLVELKACTMAVRLDQWTVDMKADPLGRLSVPHLVDNSVYRLVELLANHSVA